MIIISEPSHQRVSTAILPMHLCLLQNSIMIMPNSSLPGNTGVSNVSNAIKSILLKGRNSSSSAECSTLIVPAVIKIPIITSLGRIAVSAIVKNHLRSYRERISLIIIKLITSWRESI